jgi:hypothetical protein
VSGGCADQQAHEEGLSENQNMPAGVVQGTRSENQVIYHRGLRSSGEGRTRRAQSFETVFNPLRGSAHSAVESKDMAISPKKSTVPMQGFLMCDLAQ